MLMQLTGLILDYCIHEFFAQHLLHEVEGVYLFLHMSNNITTCTFILLVIQNQFSLISCRAYSFVHMKISPMFRKSRVVEVTYCTYAFPFLVTQGISQVHYVLLFKVYGG